jgi:hypothetical protein
MSENVGITKKRKTDASTSNAKKKARGGVTDHEYAKTLVTDILANRYVLPEDDDTIKQHLINLASYTRSLEQIVPKEKSKHELEAAAEKLADACNSGIRKQMQVRC